MYAILCPAFGQPDVMQWAETSMPEPASDEILLKIHAAGVNRADTMQRQGKYPPPEGASPILGMEAAGEVVAIGDKVTRWKIGDKICALLAGGAYAEFAVVPEGQCLPMLPNLSWVEAACLPEALVTVWANIFDTGDLQANETVLLHGGGSGIGTTAIQIVKLSGARIIVTVGTEDKAEACRKLGADHVINYKNEDFVGAVMHATNGAGVNLVLDMVGGDYINRNMSVLGPFGRHISIATQQGKNATIDMRLVMQKRLILTGSTLRGRSAGEKARLVGEIEANLWPWVAAGRLKPLIYRAYPIKNTAEAHKMMESGAHIGKIGLEVTT